MGESGRGKSNQVVTWWIDRWGLLVKCPPSLHPLWLSHMWSVSHSITIFGCWTAARRPGLVIMSAMHIGREGTWENMQMAHGISISCPQAHWGYATLRWEDKCTGSEWKCEMPLSIVYLSILKLLYVLFVVLYIIHLFEMISKVPVTPWRFSQRMPTYEKFGKYTGRRRISYI